MDLNVSLMRTITHCCPSSQLIGENKFFCIHKNKGWKYMAIEHGNEKDFWWQKINNNKGRKLEMLVKESKRMFMEKEDVMQVQSSFSLDNKLRYVYEWRKKCSPGKTGTESSLYMSMRTWTRTWRELKEEQETTTLLNDPKSNFSSRYISWH